MSKVLRAYGDRDGDGMVQMSFTLSVQAGDRAREIAKRFAESHGLREVLVCCMEQVSRDHVYFVVYGHSVHGVDESEVTVSELGASRLSREDIESRLKAFGRKVVVVGACTGSDAHTVGIDAILNYKGFAGEKGIESYKGFDAHNLGAQVDNAELISKAESLGADAILVSQVITQRNCHKENAEDLVRLLQSRGLRERYLLLLGGPRIDNGLARELGFDAGFGAGTKPNVVASFLVEHLTPVAASKT